MTQVKKKTNPSGCLRLFQFDTDPKVRCPPHIMGRQEAIGRQDRHLKEWSRKPSLRQPAISLEASPGGPRRPCPSAGGPPPPRVPGDPEQGALGAAPAGRWTPRRRQKPSGRTGPWLLQEQGPSPHGRVPQADSPSPFSVQELSFPVKSLSCLRLGLVLR